RLAVQVLQDADDQVMGQRARRRNALDPPLDARRFENADHDRKLPLAVDLAQINNLLVVDFADDDSRQLHFDWHRRTSSLRAAGCAKRNSVSGDAERIAVAQHYTGSR